MRRFIIDSQLREFGTVKFFHDILLYNNPLFDRLESVSIQLAHANLEHQVNLVDKERFLQNQAVELAKLVNSKTNILFRIYNMLKRLIFYKIRALF